jgi:hypothetical protein
VVVDIAIPGNYRVKATAEVDLGRGPLWPHRCRRTRAEYPADLKVDDGKAVYPEGLTDFTPAYDGLLDFTANR